MSFILLNHRVYAYSYMYAYTIHKIIHTYTHIYIYICMYMYVCTQIYLYAYGDVGLLKWQKCPVQLQFCSWGYAAGRLPKPAHSAKHVCVWIPVYLLPAGLLTGLEWNSRYLSLTKTADAMAAKNMAKRNPIPAPPPMPIIPQRSPGTLIGLSVEDRFSSNSKT